MIGGERFTALLQLSMSPHHGAHFNPIAIVTQLALLHDPIATNRRGLWAAFHPKPFSGLLAWQEVWCRRLR